MADGAAIRDVLELVGGPDGHSRPSASCVAFVISDGDLTSAAVTRTVTVTPVNDVPVLADVESGSAGVHGERRGDGSELDASRCLTWTR